MKNAFLYQKIISAFVVICFVVKWVLWYHTRSLTVMGDAMEGFVNLITACFSWYSLWLSMRPRDSLHPYGHGKIEFLATSVEGILLFLAGLGLLYSAIHSLFFPIKMHHVDKGIICLMMIGCMQIGMGIIGKRKGHQYGQLILLSSARHMLIDAYTTLAIGGSLVVIYYTHWYWLDVLSALSMGIWIMWNAYTMLRVGVGGIMDESDEKLLKGIIDYLEKNRPPHWVDLHNLRVIKYGSVLHLDCHLTLPWYWTVERAHTELHLLHHIIQKKYGYRVEMFIHTDSCLVDACCKICTMHDCSHRQHLLEKVLKWTIQNVTTDAKHVYRK